MGQVLHGSARTTAAVRRALQVCQESVSALARRYGVSPTTVRRRRRQAGDHHRCPDGAEEAALDGVDTRVGGDHRCLPPPHAAAVLYGLQPSIWRLTRSSLHRGLERHDICRLPDLEGDKPKRSKFAD